MTENVLDSATSFCKCKIWTVHFRIDNLSQGYIVLCPALQISPEEGAIYHTITEGYFCIPWKVSIFCDNKYKHTLHTLLNWASKMWQFLIDNIASQLFLLNPPIKWVIRTIVIRYLKNTNSIKIKFKHLGKPDSTNKQLNKLSSCQWGVLC